LNIAPHNAHHSGVCQDIADGRARHYGCGHTPGSRSPR
jgi:hypothetical protein